jgi:hypothetical protein
MTLKIGSNWFRNAAMSALCATAFAGAAQAQTAKTTTPPKAKVSAKQAEAVAAKKIGGKVVSSKYEFEDNRWQYAVVVRDAKGQLYEVEVNSTTAKVMDTEKTSAAEEAKEATADKAKSANPGAVTKPEAKEADEADEKAEKAGK